MAGQGARFIDCFAVVGVAAEEEKFADSAREENGSGVEGSLDPCEPINNETHSPGTTHFAVLETYPFHVDETLLNNLPMFCFPDGKMTREPLQSPSFFTFALTDLYGTRRYVSCLTVSACANPFTTNGSAVYRPLCLCILSRTAHYAIFREILTRLLLLAFGSRSPDVLTSNLLSWNEPSALHKTQDGLPFRRHVAHLLDNVLLPPPGCTIRFTVGRTDPPLELTTPVCGLPLADFSFRLLFLSLSLDHIVTLISCVLLEKKIVLVSKRTAILNIIAETLLSLVFPLKWCHTYIPLLPISLLSYLDCPTPFLIGINASALSVPLTFEEIIVVDVDRDDVSVPSNEVLPSMPALEQSALLIKLRPIIVPEVSEIDSLFLMEENRSTSSLPLHLMHAPFTQRHQDAIRAVFLEFILSLLEGYNQHIVMENRIFNAQLFLDEKPKECRKFFEVFLETQAFCHFLEGCERWSSDAPVPSLPPLDIPRISTSTIANASDPRQMFATTRSSSMGFPEASHRTGNTMESRLDEIIEELSVRLKNATGKPESAELFYFRALYYRDGKRYIQALNDLESAWEVRHDILEDDLVCNICATLTDSELEEAASARRGSRVFELVRCCQEERGSMKDAQQRPGPPSTEDQLEPIRINADPVGFMKAHGVSKNGEVSREDFRDVAPKLALVEDGTAADRLYDALRRKGRKVVPLTTISHYVRAMKKIMQGDPLMKRKLNLEPDEFVLKSTAALTLNQLNGNLVLTNYRVLFTGANAVREVCRLSKLETVEKFQFAIVIPPGLPCLRISFRESEEILGSGLITVDIDTQVFCVWTERDRMFDFLHEIMGAYRLPVGRTASENATMAIHNILRTEAVRHVTEKRTSSLLRYKDASAQILRGQTVRGNERERILNIETVELSSTQSPCELAACLLNRITTFCEFVDLPPDEDEFVVDYAGLLANTSFQEVMLMTASLRHVDPLGLNQRELTAFFLNVYNILVIHAYAMCKVPTKTQRKAFFATSKYSIGGYELSLDDIEHGILRGNRARPWALYPQFSSRDSRLRLVTKLVDKRIHFALCLQMVSSPNLRVYTPEDVCEQLQDAAREYCEEHVGVNLEKRRVTLPKIFDWYSHDWGTTLGKLTWIATVLSGKTRRDLLTLLQGKHTVQYARYDWRFYPKPFRQLGVATPSSPIPSRRSTSSPLSSVIECLKKESGHPFDL